MTLKNSVKLEIVPVRFARPTLEKYHYLHRARVGRQINYAIYVGDTFNGIVTYAYPMMSRPLVGIPSDEIVEFARLYLYENIPHLATCVIGKTLRRIQTDWVELFPTAKKPRLVVSWSDTTRHLGTIYKAANFIWLRRTSGAPWGKQQKIEGSSKRGNRTRHTDYAHEKDCWLYFLTKQDQKNFTSRSV